MDNNKDLETINKQRLRHYLNNNRNVLSDEEIKQIEDELNKEDNQCQ